MVLFGVNIDELDLEFRLTAITLNMNLGIASNHSGVSILTDLHIILLHGTVLNAA